MKLLPKVLYITILASFLYACKSSAPIMEEVELVELDTIHIESNSEREIYRSSEKRVNDLIHTKLGVSFSWDSAFLFGRANLTLSPYFYAVDSLILDAKGFKINTVSMVDDIGVQNPLQYSYDNSFLKIALGKTYTRKDTYQIFIDYVAMPNKLKAGGSAAITEEKGLYFINNDGSDPDKPKQIWTQGETEASSCWFPTIDSPNEKTTQEIHITVDSSYVTLSNGTLIFQTENGDGTRTDYWEQDLPHAPYLFMMAVGEFAIIEDEWRDIPVNYYVEKKYEAFGKDIYPNTPEMIEFFSTKLGYDYPWDKYHQIVVRDYVSGAMENTGAVIYGEFAQGDDRYLIDNSAEEVVAHELFHHWFGDLVTCESWSNLPLNESFATYGEYLWNEHKYGKDVADYYGRNDLKVYMSQSRVNKKKMIRFNYLSEMEMFDSHSYQKGGRILHMLRNYVRDDAFFEALQLYLKSNEFQTVEIHHLRLALERVTGEDLNWFFSQWFFGAGHPMIKLEKTYENSTLTLNISQTQEGENIAPVFKIPTKIGIIDANGSVRVEEVTLSERNQSFDFKLDKAPLLVNLDWDKVLLGEIDQTFDKDEAIRLFKYANNYLDKETALKLLRNDKDSVSLDVIAHAMDDSFWHIRREAISKCKNLATSRSVFTLNKLKSLAKEDKKSDVRAEAIAAIENHFEKEIEIEFLSERINDQSFLVVSAALNAIYAKDSYTGIKKAEELEKEDNSSLMLGIARIYAEEGKEKRSAFFENSLKKLNGFNKYPLLSSYGEFLGKQNNKLIEESIPLLKSESIGKESWFIRMVAVNDLIKIKSDKEELQKELTTRIMNEADETKKEELKKEKLALVGLNEKITTALKEIHTVEKNENLKRMIESQLK